MSNSAAFPLGPVSSDSLKMTETQKPSVLKISGSNVCSAAAIAASDLKLGNIVAVPTDTIYGVACLVQVWPLTHHFSSITVCFFGKYLIFLGGGQINDP